MSLPSAPRTTCLNQVGSQSPRQRAGGHVCAQKNQRQQRQDKQPVHHQHQLPENPCPGREGALVEGIDLFFSSDTAGRCVASQPHGALPGGITATVKKRNGASVACASSPSVHNPRFADV